MTVRDLMIWALDHPTDADVLVYRGPVLGYTYLDLDDLQVEIEDIDPVNS